MIVTNTDSEEDPSQEGRVRGGGVHGGGVRGGGVPGRRVPGGGKCWRLSNFGNAHLSWTLSIEAIFILPFNFLVC